MKKQKVKGMFNKFKDINVAQRAAYSTSFFGDMIQCSKIDMVEILGEPTVTRTSFDNFNKTFNEWILTTDEGFTFTVYDYWPGGKKSSYNDYEIIEWHIGAKNSKIAGLIRVMIKQELDNMYEPLEELNRRNREEEFEEY